MGNHRFRLSDMMPNAWFYKLKEMGAKTRTTTTATRTRTRTRTNLPNIEPPPPPPSLSSKFKSKSTSSFSYPRKSYYFTRNVSPNSPISNPQFPAKSKSDYSASSSSYSSLDSDLDSFRSDRILPTDSFDKIVTGHSDDIIINVDSQSLAASFDKLELSDLHLPPIITKPVQFEAKVEEDTRKKKKKKETVQKTKYRKSSVKEEGISTKRIQSSRRHVNSPGLRLRVNSPRIGSRRIGGAGRKSVSSSSSSSSLRSLSDSLAIVKSSFDPQRDFRESMVEMIVENNIRSSKDLEDLLACYLSLNADEYHEVIIKVFKQIWFDLTETSSK